MKKIIHYMQANFLSRADKNGPQMVTIVPFVLLKL